MLNKTKTILFIVILFQLNCGVTSQNSIKAANESQEVKKQDAKLKRQAKYYIKQGWYYERKKNYGAAIQMYEKANEIGHPHAEESLNRCRERALKNYDKDIKTAEYFFEKRKYARAKQMCLYIEIYKKDDSRNLELKKKAEAKLDSWTNPYRKKAQYYYNKNNYKKAKFQMFRLLKVNPYDEEAQKFIMHCDKMIEYDETYRYAVILYSRGRYGRAYKNFKYIDNHVKDFRDTTKFMDKCQENLKKRRK